MEGLLYKNFSQQKTSDPTGAIAKFLSRSGGGLIVLGLVRAQRLRPMGDAVAISAMGDV